MTLPAWLVPWKLYLLGIVGALALSTITIQHFRIGTLTTELSAEKSGREADRQSYRRAQAEATATNLQQVRKVEAQQAQITEDVTHDYSIRLADLRSRYDKLRSANPTTKGPTGNPGLPQARPAPSGPNETDELLLPSERLLRAQEIELQLMELQNWNREQAKVTPQ